MTLNGIIAIILRYLSEFYSFAGRLRHSVWKWSYNVRKISSSSYIAATAAVVQSLCDS